MIEENILYHNTAYIEKTPMGKRLSRYPEEVLKTMNQHARFMARYACGCEMRFATEAKNILITLFAEYGMGNIIVYKGDYVHSYHMLKAGENTLKLECPAALDEVDSSYFKKNAFSVQVWRIYFHNCICTVSHVDAMGYGIRPPAADEMPSETILAYGSSITHGASAAIHTAAYASTLARLLKADILNKGVGGSCFCENSIADYFSQELKWDYALLELGINMTGNFSTEEFEKRSRYMIGRLANTGKKLFVVSIFPNVMKYKKDCPSHEKAMAYNRILQRESAKWGEDRCVWIDGASVLKSTEYLTVDGVHPSTEGHFMMGCHLYHLLKPHFHAGAIE